MMRFPLFLFTYFQIISCPPIILTLEELDEIPIYTDTISFTEHVKNCYSFPNEYHGLDYNLLVEFEIDTSGLIKNIEFPRYSDAFLRCYENVKYILQSAAKFIPGKKDNRYVRTKIRMYIPYSDPSGAMSKRHIKNWISIFDKNRLSVPHPVGVRQIESNPMSLLCLDTIRLIKG